jgi:glycosyltransferase involved in cell wall biosynthesis
VTCLKQEGRQPVTHSPLQSDDARVFGTLAPFIEPGAPLGRISANTGWFMTLMERGNFDQYHIFLPLPSDIERYHELYRHSFGRLSAFDKLRLFCVNELPFQLAAHVYHVFHLPDPVSHFSKLQRLRNACARKAFPITCVAHSLSYSDYPALFAEHVWKGTLPCDAVFCSSRVAMSAVSAMYAMRGGRKLPRPALLHVPLGVDPAQFHVPASPSARAAKEGMRRRLGVQDHECLLLAFARISHASKMDLLPLFRAVKRAMHSSGEAQMRLVAAGTVLPGDSLPSALPEIAATLGVKLDILANPNAGDRAALYAAADVFVSPSDNIQETFGLTLLEAGVSGLPVIASDFDGYRDIIVHGESGLLAPTLQPDSFGAFYALSRLLAPDHTHLYLSQQTVVDIPVLADHISRLACNPALRARMGMAGRERAIKQYSYAACLDACFAHWEKLRRLCPEGISEEQRHLRHPAEPDFAGVFAAWPSRRLRITPGLGDMQRREPSLICRRSAAGDALYRRKAALFVYTGLERHINEERIHSLLFLARKPININVLIAQLAERSACGQEFAGFCVMWALKHDLLEEHRDA